jgi:hypothetical protein
MAGIFSQYEEEDPGPLAPEDLDGYEPQLPEAGAELESQLEPSAEMAPEGDLEAESPLAPTATDEFGYEEEFAYPTEETGFMQEAYPAEEMAQPPPPPEQGQEGSMALSADIADFLAQKAKDRSQAAERFQEKALQMNVYGK